MDICCSPGYGEPGTFYGIKKSFSTAEIWLVKVGYYAYNFVNLAVFVYIGNLPKIGLKKDLFFLTPLPVLDLESWFSGYD